MGPENPAFRKIQINAVMVLQKVSGRAAKVGE